MKFAGAAAVLAGLSMVPARARAQSEAAPDIPSEGPRPRKPGDLVTLSVENGELKDLIRMMSELTGRRFLLAADPKSFEATIVSPQKVTVAEAYQAFLTVLAANGLTVVPQGRFTKIIKVQDAQNEVPVVTSKEGLPTEDRYVTYLRRVAHVPATDMKDVLSKLASNDKAILVYGDLLLVTDTGRSVQRMMRVLDEIDVAKAQDRIWLEPLEHVAAAHLKEELDDLLGVRGASKDKDKDAAPAAAGEAHVTKIVAIDHPDALLIVGSQAGYERLLELVTVLDVPVPSDGQMHVVMLQHNDAKKIVDAINQAVSAAGGGGAGGAGATAAGATPGASARVLEGPVKVSADETNNALIVTATGHDYLAVREVIRELDRARRQVFIEAIVMDLSINHSSDFGVAFHGFNQQGTATEYGGFQPMTSISPGTAAASNSNLLQGLALGVQGPSIPVPAGFLPGTTGTTTIPGLGLFINAVAVDSDNDIMETPQILATDNVKAELHSQLNESLQQNVASYGLPSSGGANPFAAYAAPASANYGKIGPKIEITPHISDSDEVRLDITETISDTAGPATGTLGTIPFTERGAQTTLTVKSGHTAVIGGLVMDKVTHNVTKVPVLGDIPLIGALFRSTADQKQKGNLVLVLTPHIIRNEDDMREIFEDRMRERQEFIDHYFVFRDGPPVGFDPSHGHGLLAELRGQYTELAERRRLETPPGPDAPAHDPKPAMDLPNGAVGAAGAGPRAEGAPGVTAPQPASSPASPPLQVGPAPRSVERVEP